MATNASVLLDATVRMMALASEDPGQEIEVNEFIDKYGAEAAESIVATPIGRFRVTIAEVLE